MKITLEIDDKDQIITNATMQEIHTQIQKQEKMIAAAINTRLNDILEKTSIVQNAVADFVRQASIHYLKENTHLLAERINERVEKRFDEISNNIIEEKIVDIIKQGVKEKLSEIAAVSKKTERVLAGQENDHILISELPLTVRTSHCLEYAGIKTYGDLKQLTESDLLGIRNFGRKCLDELKAELSAIGLSLSK